MGDSCVGCYEYFNACNYFLSSYQTGKPDVGPAQAQRQLETDAEKFSGRYFRDKLNLNSDQMAKFREFNPVFRQQARAITIELAAKRKQMLAEMAAAKSTQAG